MYLTLSSDLRLVFEFFFSFGSKAKFRGRFTMIWKMWWCGLFGLLVTTSFSPVRQ